MSYEEEKEERHTKGKDALCNLAARNLKKTIMKDVKEAESDIASACSVFHKRHEQKTGKPITTIGEFENVTREFSKLPRQEIDKLIKEGKEEEKKRHEFLKEMRKRR